MRKPMFIMLVGLPGSGKSTYAKWIEETFKCSIHSSDDIREELSGDASNQDINKEVFNTLHKRVVDDLNNGKDVVYDATNLISKKRKSFLESNIINKVDCLKRCIIVATPYENCAVQNSQRDRVVPEDVLDRMYKQFETPFYNEGWDEIFIHYPKKEYAWKYGNYEDFVAHTMEYDQMNKHHSSTLGEHCLKCREYVESVFYEISECQDELIVAATLHDCGKPFTMSFKNCKGEDTEDAHYYGHHNVGAYNSLFYAQEEDIDKIYVSALICWHMMMHFYENWKDKTKDKYRDMFSKCPKDFWNNLNILHRGDKNAH